MGGAKRIGLTARISNLRNARGRQQAIDDLYVWLMQPVHPSSLATFRFVYGLVMCAQIWKWEHIFYYFQGGIHALPYPGVGFIKPLHPTTGNIVLIVCLIASMCVALGFYTRPANVIAFLTFAYMFHICESLHNNHFILMCHVNFVGSFLNWGEWLSIDVWRKRDKSGKSGKSKQANVPQIPYWNLLLMQLLFTIPYMYGSFAKLNWDWIVRCEPVHLWLGRRPGWILHQWWFPWFICWGGTAFDFVISFLLYWKKTRYLLGFPAAIMFNVTNKLIFNIGVFPYAMICSLILFVDPHDPAAFLNSIAGFPPPLLPKKNGILGSEEEDSELGKDTRKEPRSKKGSLYKKFVLIFMGGFVMFHSLYPFRHFVLYRSNPSWTEEGHVGAWHMKLREKKAWMLLTFEELDGRETILIPHKDPLLISLQLRRVKSHPHALMRYVSRLNQVFEEAKRPLKAIRARSCASLNGNPARDLYIPTANLKDYMDNYEIIGTTGVDKFIYAYEDAPLCPFKDGPTSETMHQVEESFKELYIQANFVSEYDRTVSNFPRLYHRSKDLKTGKTKDVFGCIWNM